jgi:hypothetical protein
MNAHKHLYNTEDVALRRGQQARPLVFNQEAHVADNHTKVITLRRPKLATGRNGRWCVHCSVVRLRTA